MKFKIVYLNKIIIKFYCTPLHLACSKGYTEIVKLLLKNPNINIHIKDDISTFFCIKFSLHYLIIFYIFF